MTDYEPVTDEEAAYWRENADILGQQTARRAIDRLLDERERLREESDSRWRVATGAIEAVGILRAENERLRAVVAVTRKLVEWSDAPAELIQEAVDALDALDVPAVQEATP